MKSSKKVLNDFGKKIDQRAFALLKDLKVYFKKHKNESFGPFDPDKRIVFESWVIQKIANIETVIELIYAATPKKRKRAKKKVRSE